MACVMQAFRLRLGIQIEHATVCETLSVDELALCHRRLPGNDCVHLLYFFHRLSRRLRLDTSPGCVIASQSPRQRGQYRRRRRECQHYFCKNKKAPGMRRRRSGWRSAIGPGGRAVGSGGQKSRAAWGAAMAGGSVAASTAIRSSSTCCRTCRCACRCRPSAAAPEKLPCRLAAGEPPANDGDWMILNCHFQGL